LFHRVNPLNTPKPTIDPTTCARINGRTLPGVMPAKESENILPTVTAGFANDVELVKK
jgi:hypothetical protein